jgi:hypothetical protein
MSILALIPIGAAAILAAAGFALRTGPGHHKAPMRERRERPVLTIHADASQAIGKLEQVQAAIEKPGTAHSPDWAFKPMHNLPPEPAPILTASKDVSEEQLAAIKADFLAAVERGKGQPLAVLPPDPPQAETGPLSPRRERLHRLHPRAITDLERAGYDAHGGHPGLILDSCFTRADAAIVAGKVTADG